MPRKLPGCVGCVQGPAFFLLPLLPLRVRRLQGLEGAQAGEQQARLEVDKTEQERDQAMVLWRQAEAAGAEQLKAIEQLAGELAGLRVELAAASARGAGQELAVAAAHAAAHEAATTAERAVAACEVDMRAEETAMAEVAVRLEARCESLQEELAAGKAAEDEAASEAAGSERRAWLRAGKAEHEREGVAVLWRQAEEASASQLQLIEQLAAEGDSLRAELSAARAALIDGDGVGSTGDEGRGGIKRGRSTAQLVAEVERSWEEAEELVSERRRVLAARRRGALDEANAIAQEAGCSAAAEVAAARRKAAEVQPAVISSPMRTAGPAADPASVPLPVTPPASPGAHS